MGESSAINIVRVDSELAGLARAYLVNRLKDADAIAVALGIGDWDRIHRIGHNMRGSAEMFGFSELAELGAALQAAADAASLSEVECLHRSMAIILANTRIEIANSEQQAHTAHTETAARLPKAGDPRCVLIVDDDEMNRILISRYLEKAGYLVRQATRGDEALVAVREEPRPAVVVLDVVMPGTSGLEVCRRIKNSRETASIPILLLTGLETTDDRLRAMEAGADDYLSKPVSRRDLIERVSALAPAAAQ
jgi:PleD family two-component response regulator